MPFIDLSDGAPIPPDGPIPPRIPEPRPVGVCSWSLAAGDAAELAQSVGGLGIDRIQLALDPIRDGRMTNPASALAAIGVRIASGMMAMAGEDYTTPASIRRTGGIVPDETWRANLAAARENAILAGDLGLDLVTFHAGFIPEGSEDPRRRVLLDRLRELASVFESRSVRIGLETGQERAPDLLRLLGELDCPSVGVNFDPGNMILYGMGDPVTALGELAPHVLQVHVKDALPPRTRGEWGTEVPVGEGAVDWAAFFAVLGQVPGAVDLMVEREAAEPHRGDIARAIRFLRHIDAARG